MGALWLQNSIPTKLWRTTAAAMYTMWTILALVMLKLAAAR